MKQNQLLSGCQGYNTAIELWLELVKLGYQTCAKNPKYWNVVSKFPPPSKLGKRSLWSDEDITQWRNQFMENVDG